MNERESTNFEIEEQLQRLNKSLSDHMSLSDRVLAQLQTVPPNDLSMKPALASSPNSEQNHVSLFGKVTMLQKVLFGSVTTALLLVAGISLTASTASVSFAQVAENVRKATSCSVVMSMFHDTNDDDSGKATSTIEMHWQSPGDNRIDRHESVYRDTQILFQESQGILIDHYHKTYAPEPARDDPTHPLMTNVIEMFSFDDDAFTFLGVQIIDGIECDKFQLDEKFFKSENGFIPREGMSRTTVWIDQTDHFPVKVEVIGDTARISYDQIVWNREFDESLFSTEPPADYTLRPQAQQ